LTLERGTSILGRVETADGSPLGDDLRITAEPAGLRRSPELGERLRQKAHETTVEDHGFFHLTGLEEGSIRLRVEKEGFAPLVHGPVFLGSEAILELAETLVLHRSLPMTVTVTPPLDPHGKPWRLFLTSLPEDRPIVSEKVGTEGWSRAGMPPGAYRIRVSASDGSAVHHEKVELRPGHTRFDVALESVEVVGTLRLGDEPLPAKVYFGGRNGVVSIRMTADEAGEFSGTLPREGKWRVEVVGDGPRVHRRFRNVAVDAGSGGVARVELELPDTLIEGEVVDADGRPAEATVLLSPLEVPESLSQLVTGDDGSFAFHGHLPGRYRLEAHGRGEERGRSDAVEGEVSGSTPWTGVRLVLRPTRRLAGQVVSAASGRPVAGARLTVEPAGGVTGSLVLPAGESDVEGFFDLDLPGGLDDAHLTILAPGFLLHQQRLRLAGDPGMLLVPLSQGAGGTLHFHFDDRPTDRAAAGARFPILYREDMIRLSLGLLRSWARLQGHSTIGNELSVPNLPPAVYFVCWVPAFTTFPSAQETIAALGCEHELNPVERWLNRILDVEGFLARVAIREFLPGGRTRLETTEVVSVAEGEPPSPEHYRPPADYREVPFDVSRLFLVSRGKAPP